METVYLETTFISYLVARPSRDLIVAAHQRATEEWWATRRDDFECRVSQVVIDEVSAGDLTEVQKRLSIIGSLQALEITEDAESLTEAILAEGVFPLRAVRDAAHVAVATVHAVDYLLTWNCRHLANARLREEYHWCVNGSVTGCRRSVRQKNSWEPKIVWEDPLVADVHRTREKLAAEYGFDVRAIFADLRQRQAALGGRLVSPKKRAESTILCDAGRDSGARGSTPIEPARAS